MSTSYQSLLCCGSLVTPPLLPVPLSVARYTELRSLLLDVINHQASYTPPLAPSPDDLVEDGEGGEERERERGGVQVPDVKNLNRLLQTLTHRATKVDMDRCILIYVYFTLKEKGRSRLRVAIQTHPIRYEHVLVSQSPTIPSFPHSCFVNVA